MEPLGKDHVDLVDVGLERGVAGRVIGCVVGRAHAFAGVEGNIGGLAGGLAVRGAEGFGAVDLRIAKGPVIMFGSGQQQFRQALIAHYIEDKADQHQCGEQGGDVKDAAQALPALALGIEEYLSIRHAQ